MNTILDIRGISETNAGSSETNAAASAADALDSANAAAASAASTNLPASPTTGDVPQWNGTGYSGVDGATLAGQVAGNLANAAIAKEKLALANGKYFVGDGDGKAAEATAAELAADVFDYDNVPEGMAIGRAFVRDATSYDNTTGTLADTASLAYAAKYAASKVRVQVSFSHLAFVDIGSSEGDGLAEAEPRLTDGTTNIDGPRAYDIGRTGSSGRVLTSGGNIIEYEFEPGSTDSVTYKLQHKVINGDRSTVGGESISITEFKGASA